MAPRQRFSDNDGIGQHRTAVLLSLLAATAAWAQSPLKAYFGLALES